MPAKLTPGQVAVKLGVSRQQIDKWLRSGRIKHVVLENGARLIERRDAKKPTLMKPGRKHQTAS
jgi:excisionase family DNA binding protein